MIEKISTQMGGKEITIQTGKLAKQAHGSVTVQCGGTMVLVTCVCSRKAKENMNFFPLTVEYQEKTFAAGRIPGGFFKREGRPTEKEILTSRMIDRPIRPLFPEGMRNEVQVVASVLSSDGENDSDVLAMIGASAALNISDIPFDGPIGGARVGLINGEFVVNPTFAEMEESKMDLIVVADKDNVIMLEAGADGIAEEKVITGIKKAQEALVEVIEVQDKLCKKIGKAKREDISRIEKNEELFTQIKSKFYDETKKTLQILEKRERSEKLDSLMVTIQEEVNPENEENINADIKEILEELEKEILRDVVLNDKKRMDGRSFDEIRPLSSEVNILPRTHGSGLFTRGETQALAITTLGTSADEQRIETLKGQGMKSFMLHYNFPPFSVGETRPMRGPGRREIGHGALAEKALRPALPSSEDFPYTIRIVSEILESNGSSSMATVCAGSLSLMASGVPLQNAVSGIAMGLVIGEKSHAVLTDIAGAEDHFGDMDFKVAGTREGVNAVQMDLKVGGVSYEMLEEAFAQAKKARLEILDHMEKTISKPLEDVAPSAPRIVAITLPADKIGGVIGPGGKMIKKIIAETGADININDDGICQIASSDKESLEKAVEWVQGLIAEPEIGKIYDAKIVKIMNFGAFCEYMPGKEGLVHVSELSSGFVKEVSDCVKEGQEVKVKLIGIDDQGRVKLSIKQAEEKK